MKKIRFLLCLAMSVLIILNAGAMAFAACVEDNSEKIMAPIDEFVSAYENIGFDIKSKNDIESGYLCNMDFDYNGSTISATVKITTNEMGEIRFDSFENDKYNFVILKSDGSIALNDEDVKIEEEIIDIKQTDELLKASGKHYNVWTQSCPYGSYTDYTKYKTAVKKKITFEQAISSYGVSVVCDIIFGVILTGFTGFTGLGYLGTAVAAVVQYFATNDPKARAMTCIDTVYVHRSKGEIIEGVHITKHSVKYYADENYKIYVDSDIFYNKIMAS